MTTRLTPEAYRKSLTARIHIAKSQLGMDEESYRALLGRFGASSCSALPVPALVQVLGEMERLGFKPLPKKSQGKPHNAGSASMPAMMSKVEALLADMGLPWAYADGICKQMYGIERCAWVREPKQLQALIAALYNKQQKQKPTKP